MDRAAAWGRDALGPGSLDGFCHAAAEHHHPLIARIAIDEPDDEVQLALVLDCLLDEVGARRH